jgi:hypothetical protein
MHGAASGSLYLFFGELLSLGDVEVRSIGQAEDQCPCVASGSYAILGCEHDIWETIMSRAIMARQVYETMESEEAEGVACCPSTFNDKAA